MELNGHCAIITGGASGLGGETAKPLAAGGLARLQRFRDPKEHPSLAPEMTHNELTQNAMMNNAAVRLDGAIRMQPR